ncbi:ABC transporter permease [Flavobacterium psychrotolerans]|uniref:ABC transporter permease n=1 Tax=Flavobacterium psychrotolerans TaxID=2169410 RepID=A0A2U1JI51_9FLAO|nr:FtsX-like permease family protein [Flavobacterium psychrotolerans]PWA04543.1 ABC transporter permease [Flavobacterium psychrotolerans]
MNFSLYIAKRYIFSRSKNNAINIITRIASAGIVIGAMSLFVVLSVFSGLKEFSLSFSNNFDPDLKVTALKGKSISISEEQQRKLLKLEGVFAQSKIIEERVLFMFDGKEEVAAIKGVDSIYSKVNDVKKNIFNGLWLKPNTYQVVVGYGISEKLSLGLFDFNNKLEVFVPKPGKGAIENPEEAFNKTSIIPVGIYAISEDLDSKYVFADLGLAQELLEYKPNQVSGIEIKLKPNADEEHIKTALQEIFNNTVIVKNRAQLNDSLYKMLNTENTAVYLIFTLVIILTLFTLAGAIIMMILDKKGNLKTLYNLGTEVKDLRKIFLLQGTLLTVFGGLIGLVLGTIIVLIQQHFQIIMITQTLAYPVVFSIKNVLLVLATIFSLGLIASWIASSRVSKKLLD